ncbi:polyprenol monophosphomannose synthase [Micromonospora sp. NPDC049497]|uniref:polyprenol monophosphomannose synthase n=1 Tax=Micromonospora sp. NPDC049497 TaxID=3364273 RepID=UPI00379EC944
MAEATDVRRPTTGHPGLGRVLVVIPTYNEADNVRQIVTRVRRAAPAVEVLVADDNSPDGTGALADALAAADPGVHVLHRTGKQGLGAAYLAGFAWARDRGYDAVVEMDADGSHAPEQLPALLHAAGDADVVIGSRWTAGAQVVNWPLRRLLLSRAGNLYARVALGMPVSDATGGYRVYRLSVLESLDLDSVCSQGYSFQVELARLAHQAGARIVEVPITFAEREHGSSKMTPLIVAEALWRITSWGVQDRRRAVRRGLHGTPTGQVRWP